MTPDDRPLGTQTGAPPPAPPRDPNVGAAMEDEYGARGQWIQDLLRLIEGAQRKNQGAIAKLQAWADRRRQRPPDV